MGVQFEALWNYAQSNANDDDDDDSSPKPSELKEISKKVIGKTVAEIDSKLLGKSQRQSK